MALNQKSCALNNSCLVQEFSSHNIFFVSFFPHCSSTLLTLGNLETTTKKKEMLSCYNLNHVTERRWKDVAKAHGPLVHELADDIRTIRHWAVIFTSLFLPFFIFLRNQMSSRTSYTTKRNASS